MNHPRSVHEHSMLLGKTLLKIVAPNYREEEHRDIFREFYMACEAAFQRFDTDIARIERHVNPRSWN
jgi:hypothetical protein